MTNEDLTTLIAAQVSVPLGRYRHYKGPTYAVIGYVWMAEEDCWGVLYCPEDARGKLVAQSISRFSGPIDRQGARRFQFIE